MSWGHTTASFRTIDLVATHVDMSGRQRTDQNNQVPHNRGTSVFVHAGTSTSEGTNQDLMAARCQLLDYLDHDKRVGLCTGQRHYQHLHARLFVSASLND